MANNINYLKKRVSSLDNLELICGSGNPETIKFTQFKLMLLDPFINIGLTMLKAPIISGQWAVESTSQELKDFVQKYFVDRWLTKFLTQSLMALDFGFSIQEKIIMNEDGYLTFRDFADIDSEDTIIYVDSYGGYNGIKVTNSSGMVELKPEKTFLYTYNKKYGNLYGQSLLKNCYRAWYDENLMNLSLLRHLESHGSPVTILYFPADLSETDSNIYSGMAQDIIKNISYRKSAAVPNIIDEKGNQLFKMEMISSQPRGEGYIDSIKYSNIKKLLGLLVPPQVILRDSDTGSYAEGITKLDTMLMMVEGIQKDLEYNINKYIIPEFISWNFDTTEDVIIKALPLENKEKDIMTSFTEKLLTSANSLADEELIRMANDYFKAMYPSNENTDIKKGNVKDTNQEVPIEDQ